MNVSYSISWPALQQLLRYFSVYWSSSQQCCHPELHAFSIAKGWAQKNTDENKITTDGFHQLSCTNLDTYLAPAADSWCWKSLSLSPSHIWGVGASAWWESEWRDIQMPEGPCYSMPVMSEAPDSLFIWILLQRSSHMEQQQRQRQQQHSTPVRAAFQLIEQDIQGQTQRVRSSGSWGWILRSALSVRGYCWLKQLNLYKWTTRIIPRVENQISGMIWSCGGMRTENTQLKAISTLCTQDTEQAKDHSAQLSFGGRNDSLPSDVASTGEVFNSQLCLNKKEKRKCINQWFSIHFISILFQESCTTILFKCNRMPVSEMFQKIT